MYDLHRLGWHSFQQLSLTIVREILGQTVESFLDSNDGGRDGAFAGTWVQHGYDDLQGAFVIQCKFTSKADKTLRVSHLTDEFAKARRLVQRGVCDSYVLMTNYGLSGIEATRIKEQYASVGVKRTRLCGATWLCEQIKENKRLRMLVPRVYGLGDLTQILDERAYAQARALLASLREDLSKVVVTESYRRAVNALDKHSFVLLIGEPAAGKTTISALLAMAALDQWNTSTLKLDSPGNVIEHWNPDEPSQFFWVDDAFGVTQYESELVRQWNHVLPQAKAMLRTGAKVVMTSRDYIYNSARSGLKMNAFPLMSESQVVVDVHDLTQDERRQILYNHLKLGTQKKTFKSKVKPHLEYVASHERFIPETARRLGDSLFTRRLLLNQLSLGRFVNEREQLLREVITGLDEDSKAALALIYMRKDALASPVELRESEERALGRMGSNLGGCLSALDSLRGSLVQFVPRDEPVWRFKHPTIGDAFAQILVANPELLEIYVQGSPVEELLDQITCGVVGLKNATIVPPTLFALVLDRLDSFATSDGYKSPWLATRSAKHQLDRFLARRCSVDFLSAYLQHHPGLFDRVATPGLYLAAVSEVPLAVTLHETGLLPENKRDLFVRTVSKYAIKGDDLDALTDEGLRSMFTRTEFGELRERVRRFLVPRLGEVCRDQERDYYSDHSPEDHMRPLLNAFSILIETFPGDREVHKIVGRERERVEEWIMENTEEEPETVPSRQLGDVGSAQQFEQRRSVFDDLDT